MSRKKDPIAFINTSLEQLELSELKNLAHDIINRRIAKRHYAGYSTLGIFFFVIIIPMLCLGNGAVPQDAPEPPTPGSDEMKGGLETSRMAPFLSDLNRGISKAQSQSAVMDLLQSHPNIKRDMLKSHQRSGETQPLLSSAASDSTFSLSSSNIENRLQAAKDRFFAAHVRSQSRFEKAGKRHTLHFAQTKERMLGDALSAASNLGHQQPDFTEVKTTLGKIQHESKIKGYAVLVKTAAALFDAIEEMQEAQRQAAPSSSAAAA
ncbi:MAG: hypothetical protein COV52_06670 [Gammaproteobacteria bacterium CG11_big_fil_rev_8_21_14_0_20_46_22]|nr:MAG: hypothetical protein COW05_00715 [Gammaproteobacteria bacterium CG12_big_fil_rev_8_21_14_0_65_46_12]PIR10922.1 MAG: hypothetical protein COV52_06670 [Gammaproteobacteria bacterium CG11_big_fil_rev_8_21_14_0_20_46_22]